MPPGRKGAGVMVTVEAFWARFDRSGGPDACWPWMGGHDGDGYGAVRVGPVVVRTHTLAFETHHRRLVRGGMLLRHVCDNPPCGNPAHLIEGEYSDNLRDQWKRKRRKGWRKRQHG